MNEDLEKPLARLFARAVRDAAIIRAGGIALICQRCYRDYFGQPTDEFCSENCRLHSRGREAERHFDLPHVEDEPTAEAVFDPRAGRYRTTSWARWGLPD